jgi:hypothetical protein
MNYDDIETVFGDQVDADIPRTYIPLDFRRAGSHNRDAHLARLKAERIQQMFEEQIAELSERRDVLLEPHLKAAANHSGAVERWHRAALAAGDEKSTVEFLIGPASKLIEGQPQMIVKDEDLLRAWAEEHGHGSVLWPLKPRPEPTLALAALKKLTPVKDRRRPKGKREPGAEIPAMTVDGEKVPGVKFIEQAPNWSQPTGAA